MFPARPTASSRLALLRWATIPIASVVSSPTATARLTARRPSNLTNILIVNNVRARATTPHIILPNSQRSFSLTLSPLDISFLPLPREPVSPSTHRHGIVISEVMYHPTNRTDGRNLEFIE